MKLYKEYISHRPEMNGLPGHSAFYLTPIPKPSDKTWYKSVPLGLNTIASTLKNLMKSVDDGNYYTNTSLRRTAKTRLTESGFNREIVMKKTGHLSSADNSYVDVSNSESAMSLALYGDSNKKVPGTGASTAYAAELLVPCGEVSTMVPKSTPDVVGGFGDANSTQPSLKARSSNNPLPTPTHSVIEVEKNGCRVRITL